MSDFVDKLKLKEAAEEDLYFADRDRELIRALREKKLSQIGECAGEKEQAESFERRFEQLAEGSQGMPHLLRRAYRGLLDEIKKVCGRRRQS